ncbi:two-component system, NtrC family, C4-dicarboxylate transport sensor histidine kinase DctB [Roseovarius azorensis]|uniref:C4-dicarboxylate transport sensor protein DctB n=1 Tax=Roseovarius azorensis TaxID=1287727 RepID=A0A1H7HTJ6_9RHOB|nr:ATP-binding protein [Roseovarius azorensis]SEK53601.1 two-component system, NtrC family, C4-dicarboxylate transport sensor histidine kinase DctB [Roseovarius azorensis]
MSTRKPGKVPAPRARTISWRARLVLIALFALAVAVVVTTNRLLTDRFTENTRNRAELRLVLYSGNLLSELRQNAIVPQLLARDPALITALNTQDYAQSTQRLISFIEEIGAASLTLLDKDGRAVATTERNRLGESHKQAAYYVDALRSRDTVFKVLRQESGQFNFYYSRRIETQNGVLGVILVEVDLRKYERAWAGISDAVMVADSEGQIILATEPRWRGLTEADALRREPANSAIQRALQATSDWTALPADAYVRGEAVMRVEGRVAFRGWRIASFTTYQAVRDKVNGYLALEIMGFAILLALAFYFLNRKAALRMALFQRESAELRALNARLQREIAERQRVQENLAQAEQTLQQSSKLAVLGEMSAAVSHELNQPLAAMKTYLAGARLLLNRNRPDEALSSFQRIDDLIERMGTITKQLKSYARQSGDVFSPVNMGDAVASALALMEPQLRQRKVRITRTLPGEPVMIMGDRVRVEQVIINLLRNAMDATENETDPAIDILLAAGETAVLTVRDNGHGITDLDKLFEPFYTTKLPGDGVGLGLAISSGIVNDLGGRLVARNALDGGAVFEMQLPILPEETRAAE